MELDEGNRTRLRMLADAAGAELDDAARTRIARRIAAEGPGVVRRARRARTFARAAGGCAVLGLCWLGIWAARDVRSAPEVASPALPRAAPQLATAPRIAPRPCELRAALAALPSALEGGGARYDLGELGAVATAPGSVVSLDAGDPCRVRVRLQRGAVAVHAAELGGGALQVVTASAEVSVHGTVFSVSEQEGALTVDVDEGRVSVRRRGRATPWALDAGQRLRIARTGEASTEPLAATERLTLRRSVGLAAGEPPGKRDAERAPSPSAEALVVEADALWRDGEHERARDRYRRAGALSGVTAEAAWLALARRELSSSRPEAARAALASHRARFPRGKLAGESLGIEFRAAVQQADHAAAHRIARELQRRHPGTPQAEAAARWSKERRQSER
jgi:hypothetical protein